MTRPIILGKTPKIEPIRILQTSRQKTRLTPQEHNQVLNRKRSDRYLKTMTTLDAGGHASTIESARIIIDAIHAELPEITIEQFPIGIVSRCYLGSPYEVHTLDLAGGIIEHYEVNKLLPSDLEKARSLCLHPEYVLVEVYCNGEMRAVQQNGEIVFVEGGDDGIR